MIWPIGKTHDPNLKSWVDSANKPDTDFPIQNLPYGVFKRTTDGTPAVGVAIGDQILDLRVLGPASGAQSLNGLMALPVLELSGIRAQLSELLSMPSHRAAVKPYLTPMAGAIMCLPAAIGDYTDFFASIFHATNAGRLFRPDHPLLPNYKHVPVGYHGRASSIVISGSPVRRPWGQRPVFGPTQSLDYELEAGFFVGRGNRLGEPIPIIAAQSRIFGLCLLNDWSARDIQAWESQPLGPFLAKSFATTISPWVVTLEALAPYRTPEFKRPPGDPPPLPYLATGLEGAAGGIDLKLEVYISSLKMRQTRIAPMRVCQSNLKDLYWTIGQLLTHHASNGCNLRSGDLIGSGTVSGPGENERGCLLELTRNGAEPIHLRTGESRKYLDDGDEVILRGYCERDGFARIGFGECRGIIIAQEYPGEQNSRDRG